MSSYKDYKKRALQNLEVKAEYDALQPEYDIIQAMIDARVQQNMTQKDLSARTGITQADISRIENVEKDGDIRYHLDEDGNYVVPKRNLEDVVTCI